ncbi:MAG: hypothetical protein HC814_06090 [Rhodobacteraceae bacterium]|nr:hypothetical protein [Paracoccaceae bacterium]
MRQIFSSPRLENCEAVAELLGEEQIETRIINGDSFRRATKRDFSYTDRSGRQRWPSVWVMHADNYTRARQLMRDNGIEVPTTRNVPGSFVSPPGEEPANQGISTAMKFRFALLGIAVALAIGTALRMLGLF